MPSAAMSPGRLWRELLRALAQLRRLAVWSGSRSPRVFPLVVIPFATSIVLVIGSPEAEPAQPRALVGGHIVATLVGLAMLRLTGPHAWAAAVAVGLAIVAMYATGTFSSAGRDQSAAGGFQQPSLVILVRAGACGRRAADRVCLLPGTVDPAPAVAAALAIKRVV
jgi:hypothetical protein